MVFSNRLYIDALYYRSKYNNFIGITRVSKPFISPDVNLFASALRLEYPDQHDVYYIYSNSQEKITVQGITLGIKMRYINGAIIDANGTYAVLESKITDPVVPGFNTPKYKTNVSYSHREFYNMNFNIIWRWQDSFLWQSPFGDGQIDAINTIDFQCTYRLPNINSMIKIGSTNMFDIGYNNTFGGPQIGSLVYVSFVYDQKMY